MNILHNVKSNPEKYLKESVIVQSVVKFISK